MEEPPWSASRRVVLSCDDAPLPGPLDVAARLTAAKPVSWRGRSDLPQYPWAKPFRGTWLVIDLWAGVGGLCVALLAMGVHFYALSAESDPEAVQCAAQAMPNIVHVDTVEQVQADMFRGLLQRRQPRGILVGGGSPCQGNSSLNRHRRGLDDPRSQQPLELQRIVQELRALPEAAGLEIVTFLENVASMPAAVRVQYSTWLGCRPICMDAASCGWVRRRRLFWLGSSTKGITAATPPPESWIWAPNEADVPTLRFEGKKPVPFQVWWIGPYLPLLDPAQVLRAHGAGAMHPFTREFWHPADRVRDATPAAVDRFHQDHRRFPPAAYEESSLLWSGSTWRTLHPSERCQLMGIPPDLVEPVRGSQARRTQVKNSLIGNGFHIPCIIALMTMLPSVLTTKLPCPISDHDELALHSRLSLSVWAPGRLQVMPGMLQAEEVVSRLGVVFPYLEAESPVWSLIRPRLSSCDLSLLQAYPAWRHMRQEPWQELGPVPIWGRQRTDIYAGLSGQRYASSSARGLDHLLVPGLGKEAHMAASAELPTPFHPRDWPEPDIGFVVEALFVWQQFLPRYTTRLRHVLRTLATALTPLEEALAPFRCQAASQVARGKKPALTAVLAILIRWPDLSLAQQLVQGFPIVGSMPHSGVFRPVRQEGKADLSEWLGAPAAADVQRLIHSRPPLHSETIYHLTLDEIAKGFCSPLRSMKEMDDVFGEGGWRAVERFLITQPDGKQRAIDNARKSGHNHHTTMPETISTVNVDFVAALARMVDSAFALDRLPPPCWLDLRLGTDDLPDAYRGLPVCDEHLRYSNVAIYVPDQGWRFTTMYGLAYGLESAVVNFNRFPQLGVAIVRRCLLGFAAAYFDDELAVDFVRDHDVSQVGLQLTFQLLGAPPQPAKSFAPGHNRHYLGTSVHVGDFVTEGLIRFQPKFSTSTKILKKLRSALETSTLSPDDAGKLRGDLNWMFSMCAGYTGRIGGPLLAAKQKAVSADLSMEDCLTLRLLAAIVACPEPRVISIRSKPAAPLVIYSDASFENDTLRLGWVIIWKHMTPSGVTCTVPQRVIDTWQPRTQQIYPGETLCGLLVPWFHGAPLAGYDVLWFVDNEAAVASLIKGGSSQADVHTLVQLAHYLLQTFRIRVWFEWIDSHSNPSDGLSRAGLDDTWTQHQAWHLFAFDFPSALEQVARPEDLSSFLPLWTVGVSSE